MNEDEDDGEDNRIPVLLLLLVVMVVVVVVLIMVLRSCWIIVFTECLCYGTYAWTPKNNNKCISVDELCVPHVQVQFFEKTMTAKGSGIVSVSIHTNRW